MPVVGQNMALYASPAARNFNFCVAGSFNKLSAFQAHLTSFVSEIL